MHESLSSFPSQALNKIGIEDSTWCIIPLDNSDNLVVGIVYHSPSSDVNNNDKIINCIKQLKYTQNYSHLLIMGDFNMSQINWSNLTVTDGNKSIAA